MEISKGPGHLFVLSILLCLLFMSGAARAQELRWGGYFKSLNVHVADPPGPVDGGQFSSNRFRLDISGRPAEKIFLEFSLENLLLVTDPEGLLPLPQDSPNRAIDLEQDWNRSGTFADQLFVDRLNLRTTFAGLDWTVGRQAVGFGRITLFSPLDVIAPFPPDALDTEVRPGVDAFRVSRFVGMTGQLSAISVFGDNRSNNSYLGAAEGSFGGIDLLGIAGTLRERPMAGAGAASQVFGMGVKAEAAFYRGKDTEEPDGDLRDDFAIAGLEIDYRFENDLTLFLQYLYNGAGTGDPENYPAVIRSAPFREGLSFLLGRHYLLAAPGYDLHPLVNLSALLIWNLEDDSFLLRPLLNISLSDNSVLQLFWSLAEGRGPERIPRSPLPLPRSEFGSAGDSGGFFFKYFF